MLNRSRHRYRRATAIALFTAVLATLLLIFTLCALSSAHCRRVCLSLQETIKALPDDTEDATLKEQLDLVQARWQKARPLFSPAIHQDLLFSFDAALDLAKSLCLPEKTGEDVLLPAAKTAMLMALGDILLAEEGFPEGLF